MIIFWSQISIIGYRHFSNEDYIFSYPNSWQEISGKNFNKYNEQIKSGIVKLDSENSSIGIYIEDADKDKTFDRDKTIETMKKFHEKRHNTYDFIYADKIDFKGIPAIDYRYDYSYIKEYKGETYYRSDRQIIFYKDGKIYDIMFSTDPKDFEKDNEDFEKIISTFKLIK